MSETAERKIQSERYVKRNSVCLDYDDGGYTNSYEIFDGDKPTGISVVDSGHSEKGGHKRSIRSGEIEFKTLRDAIFAYEDFDASG